LSGIPPRFKKSASELLIEINKRGSEFTWNSNGTVFINQTAIPTSNIFEIFPTLYKVKKPLKIVPGLLECISQLNEMGLSNLIVQKEKKIWRALNLTKKMKAKHLLLLMTPLLLIGGILVRRYNAVFRIFCLF
jgi:hypothetical protein